MSPDPTSPSPLVAAAITAGSGHSSEPGATTPPAGVSLDRQRLETRAYDGPSPPQTPPASGEQVISSPTGVFTQAPRAPEDAPSVVFASPTPAAEASIDDVLTGPPHATASTTTTTTKSRIIKRYSNRKLYDTKSSRYVTLLQIAEMVRTGEEVQVIDNRTKEDKTEATLALIISEELKASPRGIPLSTLRALIREGAECDSRLGRPAAASFEALFQAVFSPSAPPGTNQPSAGAGSGAHHGTEDGTETMKHLTDAELRANFERWCAAIDQRVRSLPDTSTIAGLEARVQHLNERLAELERRLGGTGE